MPDHSTSNFRQTALAAGLLYIAIIILGISSEVLLRGAVVVPGDAGQTARNILARPDVLRLSLAADIGMAVADVALAVLLYVLLRPVSPVLAAMAAAFRLMQMAVVGASLLNQQAALLLLHDPALAAAIDAQALNAQALHALDLHAHGYDLGLVFFGAGSVIVGLLLIRSPDFPRLLGAMVVAAGLVYVTGSLLRFLAPDLSEAFQIAYLLPLLSETALALWLTLAIPLGRSGSGAGRPAMRAASS